MDREVLAQKAATRPRLAQLYTVLGKVGEGTYGNVYKAVEAGVSDSKMFAIKKFKTRPSTEGEGISLTAIRELTLLKELKHENIVLLKEVLLELEQDASNPSAIPSLHLVFEYAEHDLLEIIRVHKEISTQRRLAINDRPSSESIRSLMWQTLNGVDFLHQNWVIHRDLKPSNILVTGEGYDSGTVKLADFGLARVFQAPLKSLDRDGDVVTIWYRAPELLLGAKHYTKAIDLWAIGCIFIELFISKAIFPGKEAERQPRSSSNAGASRTSPGKKRAGESVRHPIELDQLEHIFKIMGTPLQSEWPDLVTLPHWAEVSRTLKFYERLPNNKNLERHVTVLQQEPLALDLILRLLTYDPNKRITAAEALKHAYFTTEPPCKEAIHRDQVYPKRGATTAQPTDSRKKQKKA